MRPAHLHFSGPRISLRAIVFAAVLVPLVAQADVFGSGRTDDITKRVQQLEQTITELKTTVDAQAANPQASGLTPPPLPHELEAQSEFALPDGYVVLAEVNGRTLIREGERRLLLTPEEFERYKEAQRRKAAEEKAMTASAQGAMPGLNTPPPPPPGASQVNAQAQAALDSASAATGPRPVTPKKSKSAKSK